MEGAVMVTAGREEERRGMLMNSARMRGIGKDDIS
jgi:hypothetical protein